MTGFGGLTRAVIDGLLAQRELKDDSDIIGPTNRDNIEAIIRQGSKAEARLQQLGMNEQLDYCYENAGVDRGK